MSKALQLYHSDQICIAVKFNTNATSAITLGRPSEVLLLSFAKKNVRIVVFQEMWLIGNTFVCFVEYANERGGVALYIMRHHSNTNLIHVHMKVKHNMNTNVCLIYFEIESNSETLHLDENLSSEQCYLFFALVNSNIQKLTVLI